MSTTLKAAEAPSNQVTSTSTPAKSTASASRSTSGTTNPPIKTVKLHSKPTKGTRDTRKTTQRSNKSVGVAGEKLSCLYLEQNGFVILERNWRCKSGEADIIALESGTLVFIEVKTRSNANCGLPEDAVTHKKRIRYENIAMRYLMTHRHPSGKVRFDVISIVTFNKDKAFLRHHRDAFCAGE
ncbi:MAG: YraN family protein [Coriobacteriales bacterium]|nr:YraN family protein [Coriobacteriales bacterium]